MKQMRKQVRTLAACTAVMAAAILPRAASADAAAAQAEIHAADAAYWQAYNRCDYKTLDSLTAEDVEFYHDLAGAIHGRADLTGSVRDHICNDKDAAVRRDAKPGEVQTFLLHQGGQTYGALVTGQHHFFRVMKVNGAAVPTDIARFSSLWIRHGNAWKLSRVVSYDHQPVAQPVDRKPVALSAAELDGYVGTYAAKIQPLLVFQRAGGNLSVEVGGRPVTLYPQSATSFFMKERNIVVQFQPVANGKSPGFTLLENGTPVDEGIRK